MVIENQPEKDIHTIVSRIDSPKIGMTTGISEGVKVYGFPADHEYADELQGTARFPIYQRMVASDGALRAMYRGYSLPIQQAETVIEGGRDDIREWVESWFFKNRKSFLTRATRYLQYGTFAFEQVFGIVNGRTQEVAIKPRPPWTWWRPDYDHLGNVKGIEQRFGANFGYVPANRMVLFVNESESEGILGDSLFRASWKPWTYVDLIERVDAIGIERHGVGVPYAKVRTNDRKVFDAIDQTLTNVRTHQNARLIFDPEVVEDFGIAFNDYKNDAAIKSLEYHRRMMFVSALMQFLAIGGNVSGGYSLSKDWTEFFLAAIKSVAAHMAEVENVQRIKRAVDMNFAGLSEDDYPKARYTNLDAVGMESLGNFVGATKDYLTWTPETENALRGEAALPQLTDEQAAKSAEARMNASAQKNAPDASLLSYAPASSDNAIMLASKRKRAKLANGFWREKTQHEQFTACLAIEQRMDSRQEQKKSALEAIRATQVRRHTEQLRKFAKKGELEIADIQKFQPLNIESYRDELADDLQAEYRVGELEVKKELDRQEAGQPVVEDVIADRTNDAKLSVVAMLADESVLELPASKQRAAKDLALMQAKAEQLANDISATVAAAYRNAVIDLVNDPTLTVDQIIQRAEQRALSAGNPTLSRAAAFAATTPLQLGRTNASKSFQESGDVDFSIYSAIIDASTCEVCFAADGEIIDPEVGKPAAPNPECLGTIDQCRCIPIPVRKV